MSGGDGRSRCGRGGGRLCGGARLRSGGRLGFRVRRRGGGGDIGLLVSLRAKGRSALCIGLSRLALERSLDAIVLESRGCDEEGCARRAIQGGSGFWNDECRRLRCPPCDYGYSD